MNFWMSQKFYSILLQFRETLVRLGPFYIKASYYLLVKLGAFIYMYTHRHILLSQNSYYL